jgi:hypothetical protein
VDGCFVHTGDEDSLNIRLAAGVESGKLSLHDADAVREFAAFLRAVGGRRPIPLEVLREFQGFLNISDEELARIEASRAG